MYAVSIKAEYAARRKTLCLSLGFVTLFEPFVFGCYDQLHRRVLETLSFQAIRLVKTYVSIYGPVNLWTFLGILKEYKAIKSQISY